MIEITVEERYGMVRVLGLKGLSAQELPREYLNGGYPRVWVTSGDVCLSVETKELQSCNYTSDKIPDMYVGQVMSKELFLAKLRIIKAAGKRLAEINQKAKRWDKKVYKV